MPTIGQFHAETMAASLRAALRDDLPAEVASQITAEYLAQGWAQAITTPPSPDYRVLMAMEGAAPVGFASFAPADQQVVGDEDGDTPTVIEILALEVPETHGRKGHGTRLLSAIADLSEKADEIQVWIAVGDEAKTRFYQGAGFGPRGMRRTFAIGDREVTEQNWYAVL